MIRIEASTTIARSPQDVFAYISDFSKNPEWQDGMIEARFTSDPPLRVGSTYSQVARFLGRRIESTFLVTEYQPGSQVQIESTSGPFAITVTREVRPVEGGARVTAIVEGGGGGFFKIAEPLLARMVSRTVQSDYRRLKGVLEAVGD